NNRRAFFQQVALLAGGASAPVAAARRPRVPVSSRAQQALTIRESAALFEAEQAEAAHLTNGDEGALPAYIGSFTKGLPHTQNGEVVPADYQSLLQALSTGTLEAL